jgi:drug/metabolite transporter (DMT)-like permease
VCWFRVHPDRPDKEVQLFSSIDTIMNVEEPCSPNPCHVGASCIPVEGQAYCRCQGENEYYQLGRKPCLPFEHKLCLDAEKKNICGNGVRCITIFAVVYCECPNGEFVDPRGTFGCPSASGPASVVNSPSGVLDVSASGSAPTSTEQATSTSLLTNTTSCPRNPCSGVSTSCTVKDGMCYYDCPGSGWVQIGQPCPAPASDSSSSLDSFYYVSIALLGIIILGGLLLCKMRSSSPLRTNKETDLVMLMEEQEGETRCQSEKGDYEQQAGPDQAHPHKFDHEEEKQQQQLMVMETKQQRNMKGMWIDRAFAILSAALWGSNFGIIKEVVAVMPAGLYTSIRFAICALVTLPILLCFKGVGYPQAQGWGLLCRGLESGLWLGVANASQALSLRTMPASVAGFLAGTMVIIVPFLDLLVSIPVTTRQVVAALLGLTGIGIVSVSADEGFDSASPASQIDMFLALCVPLFLSVGFWRAGHAMELYPSHGRHVSASQMQTYFLVSVVYSIFSGEISDLPSHPWKDWLTDYKLCFYILWTALMATYLSNYLFMLSLRTLSSAEQIAIYVPCEQLFAAGFSIIFFGERIGWQVGVGAVFLISGSLLAVTNKSNSNPI